MMGGDFENGAITGAYGRFLNDGQHKVRKFFNPLEVAYGYLVDGVNQGSTGMQQVVSSGSLNGVGVKFGEKLSFGTGGIGGGLEAGVSYNGLILLGYEEGFSRGKGGRLKVGMYNSSGHFQTQLAKRYGGNANSVTLFGGGGNTG